MVFDNSHNNNINSSKVVIASESEAMEKITELHILCHCNRDIVL